MNQHEEFEMWWDKNKPNICEEQPCVKSYAERAWEAATSNHTPAWRCKKCEHLYEDKVSQCDCLPEIQEWTQVFVIDVQ